MRWHLILKEFCPELKYIKGENNIVADTLSCLEMRDNQDILNVSELYGYDEEDLPDSDYPICYQDIAKAQRTDAKLKKSSHIKTIPSTPFVGAIKTIVLYAKIKNMFTYGTTK